MSILTNSKFVFFMNKIFVAFPILSLLILSGIFSSNDVSSPYEWIAVGVPILITGVWAFWFYYIRKKYNIVEE